MEIKKPPAPDMELLQEIVRRALGAEEARALGGRNVESTVQALVDRIRALTEKLQEFERQFPNLQQSNQSLQDAIAELRRFSALETTAWVVDSVGESVGKFYDVVKKCVDYREIALVRVDMQEHRFEVHKHEAVSAGFRRAIDNVIDTGLFAWTMSKDDPLFLSVPTQDLGYTYANSQTMTLALLPMVVLREPIGVVCLTYPAAPESSSPPFLQTLKSLVKHFAIYLQRLEQLELLRTRIREAVAEKTYSDSVINSFAEGMISLDTAGRIKLVNPTAEIILGREADELAGRLPAEVFPQALHEMMEHAAQSVRRGEPVLDYELELVNERGNRFFLGISCNRIRDERGADFGMVFLFRDLFSRMELARLRESDRSKSERIEQTQQLLAGIRQKLIQTDKLASVGKMAAGIAHEINNPLGVISGYIQILMMETTAEQQEKYQLKIVQSELTRIKKIVRKLLDFARQQNDDAAELFSPVQINDVLRETAAIMGNEAARAGVEIALQLAGDLPQTLGNADQLKQVAMNIMINAFQAMSGGGRLEIRTAVEEVVEFFDLSDAPRRGDDPAAGDYRGERGSYRRAGDPPNANFRHFRQGAPATPANAGERKVPMIVVRIKDSGTGIRAEDVKRVFDPFFSTKGQGEGTGLGLSTSYGIVRNHGGTIEVESTWGSGATFVIYLIPLAGEAGAA